MIEYEDKTIRNFHNCRCEYCNGTCLKTEQVLKIAPDNTITIKKVKDSYSREEVKILLLQACIVNPTRIEEWIEENL